MSDDEKFYTVLRRRDYTPRTTQEIDMSCRKERYDHMSKGVEHIYSSLENLKNIIQLSKSLQMEKFEINVRGQLYQTKKGLSNVFKGSV